MPEKKNNIFFSFCLIPFLGTLWISHDDHTERKALVYLR